MYAYDKAHELAKALSSSPEYKTYQELKKRIDNNPGSKALIQDLKKKQFELQAEQMSGKKPEESKLQQIQSMYSVLSTNTEVASYLSAEMTFNKMFADIYKIIADEIGLDLDFLK